MSNPPPLAAVLGYPAGHSKSPRLHGQWLTRYGLNGHYIPLTVHPDDLETTLRLLPRLGFRGVNVTIPHKEPVLALAASATETARRIGAANTLTFVDGGYSADNTDAYGFVQNILDVVPDWSPRCVAVLGAGGASRAVIWALIDRGAQEIRVTNRSADRADALARAFGPLVRPVPWQARADMLADCDTLVNTTSLGMTGQPPLDLSLDRLRAGSVVSDLVYVPLRTPLLAAAADHGHIAVDGLGMLLHQGVPGFERWFHVKPDVDPALRAAVLGE